MSLTDLVAKHGLDITGVIHAGAHLGEEADTYQALGVNQVWWIEANPDIVPQLFDNVRNKAGRVGVITALVGERDDEPMVLHVTNHQSMSSSVLAFGTHPNFSPDTVFVEDKELRSWTLDTIVAENNISGCNFLAMDLQGAELMALKGATKLLEDLDAIFTEINVDEVYKGCARLPQLDEFLGGRQFLRVETYLVPGQGWGDALYVRRGPRS